jgi:hypothetical protein
MAISILGDVRRLSEEDEQADVNGPPGILRLLANKVLEIFEHVLAVFLQDSRMRDAVELGHDHARQGNPAVQRI